MAYLRTPLYDFHRAFQARFAPFAGWEMPVHYPTGIKAEHLFTRASAALFDVSHMVQITLEGDNAGPMIEALTPTDVTTLHEGHMRYAVLLNSAGGVIDDLIISRWGGGLHLVVNAGRAAVDIAHLKNNLLEGVHMQVKDKQALLALQGPQAANILEDLGADLSDFHFMQLRLMSVCSIPCVVMRSGYTGEDGFEISLPASDAEKLAYKLAAYDEVMLAGLGARNTLRMEAGLPLWGHELDETINPVEAGIKFAISKRRRALADFPGAQQILHDLEKGPARSLTAILPQTGRPIRDGVSLAHDGQKIGHISSGGFSPTLDKPIALGFIAQHIATQNLTAGEILAVTPAGNIPVIPASLPLVSHRFARPAKR